MLVGKQTPRKNVQLVNPPSENTTIVSISDNLQLCQSTLTAPLWFPVLLLPATFLFEGKSYPIFKVQCK